MSSTAYPPHLLGLSTSRGLGNCGVSIIPPFSSSASASGGFYIKDAREHSESTLKSKETSANDLEDNREMTDCQRSFSEGRLVDSDFSREGLSQSHDSVFSESATASSLSIVLKAELFDVLRKRRNRPDASDEDLGLPRSPTTPQRKDQAVNQSEVSSLSLLSIASSDLDDELSSNYGLADKTNSSISSKMSSSQDASKTSDEIDFVVSSSGSRLSHSAAKHKMAIRPKKKGPTRHRRPIESTILPSTPEVNEEVVKVPFESKDIIEKGKSHSLPPGVNAKVLEQHSLESSSEVLPHIKRSKTEKVTSPTGAYSVRNIAKSNAVDKELVTWSNNTSTVERKEEDGSFFRRLLQRNSKKNKKNVDECDATEEKISTNSDIVEQSKPSEKEEESSHKIEETRKQIRKDAFIETKSSFSAMLNTFLLSPDHETDPEPVQKAHKPKSGPAARQRIMPKDLTNSPLPDIKGADKAMSAQFVEEEKDLHLRPALKSPAESSNSAKMIFKFSGDNTMSTSLELPYRYKRQESPVALTDDSHLVEPRMVKSLTEETFNSNTSVRDVGTEHFEKRERIQPRIVGLSPFLQKVARTESSAADNTHPVPKPRKSVEKSKSFRYYSEGTNNESQNNLKKYENMPSLPDLTFSRKAMEEKERQGNANKSPLAFEINDNNLIKLRREEEPLPLSQGIYTKNIILTTTKSSNIGPKQIIGTPCSQNITEIEENIDKLVKSPFVTVLKKSTSSGEALETKNMARICVTSIRKTETVEKEEKQEIAGKAITTELKKSEMTKTDICEQKEKVTYEKQEQKTIENTSVSETITSKVETRTKEPIKQPMSVSKNRRNSSILEKFEVNEVPEFMKIQLNRVDSTRPKSNIVLSKNAKDDDKDSTKRYSNESVEITENKPPLPPETSVKRSSVQTITKTHDETMVKSPTKKVDEENNILKNSENTQSNQLLFERRKSVTDEKLKYEKKIEELKKKPLEDSRADLRKASVDEETGVVLRKKSFAASNHSSNKEDTPELMKVFARRSLKIKDEEMQSSFDEIEKTNSLKKFASLDSDKENQSSSEEKLDKLPKVEITIQPKQANGGLNQKSEEKNRNSLTEFRKPNNSITSTPTKSYVPPIRYSNIGYRSVSTIYSKTTQSSTTTSSIVEQQSCTSNNINEQNNNACTNNNKKVGIRHTIGPSNQTTIIDQTGGTSEFKGILQRRAEWEKRAKEALK